MSTYAYLRVSTVEQNLDRQRTALKTFCKNRNINDCIVIEEKISGFNNKTAERKINTILQDKKLKHLIIHEISRLGRRFIDVVTTLDNLKERGVKVSILGLGMDSFLENGKVNPTFSLITSVLANLAETMYLDDKEKKQQGIEEAKKKGKYKGRKTGAVQNDSKTLEKHNDIVKLLSKKSKNYSLREISALTNKSVNTVRKIKTILSA